MAHDPAEDDDTPTDVQPAIRRIDDTGADDQADELPEDAENVPEDETGEVVEEHLEAREATDAEQTGERIADSQQREAAAKEVTNHDNHRDEPPFES